ncbi:MAG: hypothetical protein ACJ74D_04590 [Gaiellaceae bacterium]
MPKFLTPLILVVVAGIAAATFGVATAHASTCSSALIRDWYVDGRIDRTYPVHCYREALKDVPEDQVVYGTLRDDLNRALAAVISDNNGNVGPNTPVPPSAGGGGDDPSSSSGGGSGGGFFHWLAKEVGPGNADSVPVPLLVLAGLALALVAAAAISFFARRAQAKKAAADPPPGGPYV